MLRPLSLVFLMFFVACAQVVPPDGGARDETAPVILSSMPENFSVNYSGQSIVLLFDEFIELRDQQQQVIVSPPLGTLNYRIRGKELTITFDSIPEPNTTYTIQFGEAIVDFTEQNPLDSNRFIFSTGPFLDSLSLRGMVRTTDGRSAEKGTLVMLYRQLIDSIPYLSPPDFVARVKDGGNYEISNLKEGAYKVFALADANQNYLYDDPAKESIAFIREPVILSKDTNVDLMLFKEAPVVQSVLSAKTVGPGVLQIAYAMPEPQPMIFFEDSLKAIDSLMQSNFAGDTVTLWLPSVTKTDTFTVLVQTQGEDPDTFRIQPSGRIRAGAATAVSLEKLTITPVVEVNKAARRDSAFLFRFNIPVKQVDSSRITINDTVAGGGIRTFSPPVMQFLIAWENVPDSANHFVFLPGAFVDIFGNQNDTSKFSIPMNAEDYYGNLTLTPVLPQSTHPYILILQNAEGGKIQEDILTTATKITYAPLPPGAYRLSLVFDVNGNGRWDTGNYLAGLQPEKILIYHEPVNVRSNWDLDLTWDISAPVGAKKIPAKGP